MDRRSLSWIGNGGDQRITYLNSSAGAPMTMAALQALSLAGLWGWYEGALINSALGGPVYADYPSVGDMAWLDMVDAFNNHSRLYLPAPLIADMDPDGETIDLASPAIAALAVQALVESVAIPSSARAITSLTMGALLRRGRSVRDDITWSVSFPILRRGLVWADCQGRTTMTVITAQGSVPLTTATLQAASNAIITQFWEGILNYVGTAAIPGVYGNVLDTAWFYVFDDQGNESRIALPSPTQTIFLPDNITVDLSNAGVITLINAMIAELVVTSSGRLVQGCRGAWLQQPYQVGIR